jgi:hypothetical protein
VRPAAARSDRIGPDNFSLDDDPESQARATIGHYYSFMLQHADAAVAAVAKGEDEVRERVRAFAEQDATS